MGLRLGTAICGPHSCQRCGSAVDELGIGMLSVVEGVKEDINGTQL